MAMKISILFLLVAASLFVAVKSDDDWVRFQLADPKGFRVMVKTFTGLLAAGVSGGVYREPYDVSHPFETFSGQSFFRSDGWWVYENREMEMNPSDKSFVAVAMKVEKDGQETVEVKAVPWNVPMDANRID